MVADGAVVAGAPELPLPSYLRERAGQYLGLVPHGGGMMLVGRDGIAATAVSPIGGELPGPRFVPAASLGGPILAVSEAQTGGASGAIYAVESAEAGRVSILWGDPSYEGCD
jgi:hypothetical protein